MNLFFKASNQRLCTFLTIATLSLIPFQTSASLIGDTIDGTLTLDGITNNFFDISTPLGIPPVSRLVTDPGVEFTSHPAAIATISADFIGDSFSLSFSNPFPFQATLPTPNFLFEDLDWVGSPGFIIAVINTGGLAPLSIAHGLDSISVGYSNIVLNAGQTLVSNFDIIAVHVPEPSTYLLLGTMAGFALFAAQRKKKYARNKV